ncbi:hypothetical protein A2U01_0033229 [Trifolium medium]|uniref:Uncharacterized protein n=1 Tax=Trifolium medium TaxID=97028 RepID=A0A392PLE7_9FABA|nr:hypothetical protein [Trifolium medium]
MAEKGKQVIQEEFESQIEEEFRAQSEEEFEDYVAKVADLLKDHPRFELGSRSKDSVRFLVN